LIRRRCRVLRVARLADARRSSDRISSGLKRNGGTAPRQFRVAGSGVRPATNLFLTPSHRTGHVLFSKQSQRRASALVFLLGQKQKPVLPPLRRSLKSPLRAALDGTRYLEATSVPGRLSYQARMVILRKNSRHLSSIFNFDRMIADRAERSRELRNKS
jgi:hypothetical protein